MTFKMSHGQQRHTSDHASPGNIYVQDWHKFIHLGVLVQTMYLQQIFGLM